MRYTTQFYFALIIVLILFHSIIGFAQQQKSFGLDQNIEILPAKNEAYNALLSNFLKTDIQNVFGTLDQKTVSKKIVLRIVGEKTSGIPDNVFKVLDKPLRGKWEVFSYKIYRENAINYLIISGSDKRGLAYGVFNISEKIGVSPWYFWADVPIQKRTSALSVNDTISSTPSVKYRGIFINDEDWGLQPWAAKTFEPETKDIGPKTYAKVFELLLRLKANLILPAMHPSTKAFYYYPQNKIIAQQYHIVVGTTHAEPLMRNNVDEWKDSTMGEFNYLTNKDRVIQYWRERLAEAKPFENLYSMGMRGKHDSGMEGVKSQKEAVELTNRIIKDQRNLLNNVLQKPQNEIPQVITLYKEVLELYKVGLEVPEDITLIWPDDNYGYIKNLSNEDERKRAGGSGVYYHASYWGRPHDYLWISSTDPALMRFEMQKAYTLKADKVWVVNVGDIKPLEYPTQLFLDMAYNIQPF
ncbi:MAG: glycosyl hydrolase 115 family protein [Spirosomataceae bacterium]